MIMCVRLIATLLLVVIAASALSPATRAYKLLDEAATHRKEGRIASQFGQLDKARTHQASASSLTQEARDLLEEAVAAAPEELPLLEALASVYLDTGDRDLAAETWLGLARLAPHTQRYWAKALGLFADLGPYGSAAANECIEGLYRNALSPDDVASAHALHAAYLYDRGLYELAEQQLEISRASGTVGDHFTTIQALLLVRNGKLSEGESLLESIGALDPADQARLTQRLDTALEDLVRYRRTFPDDAQHHANYGKLLMRIGRLGAALLPLEQAVKLDDRNFTLWNLLGSARTFTGDVTGAVQAYNKSIALNSDQPLTREMLERLGEAGK